MCKQALKYCYTIGRAVNVVLLILFSQSGMFSPFPISLSDSRAYISIGVKKMCTCRHPEGC